MSNDDRPGPDVDRWSVPTAIMIIALVAIMIIGTVVSPVVAEVVDHRRDSSPTAYGPATPVDPGGTNDGSSGAGDPYYPNYGNGGYDVRHYAIDVTWTPATETLSGRTTITMLAAHSLDSFYLDLVLPVDRVWVDGRIAQSARESPYDIKITPQVPLRAGHLHDVTVSYAGAPADYVVGGATPWLVNGDEVTAAGEPEGAAWWYPANDYPDDPATFDISITVPAGMEAISVGALLSADSRHEVDRDTWHWRCDQRLNTYQSFISIGQYELRRGTADGLPYLYAVSSALPESTRQKAFANLARTPAIIEDLTDYWGPYPYRQLGGIVVAQRLWFAGLETATRPVYAADAITEGTATDLLTHELAHMWFGDSVTLEQWNDIFISEAYASFTPWLRTERTGGVRAEEQLADTYDRLKDNADFWRIRMNDPGKDHLFDAVYQRGPMTLQALRKVMGDPAFFRFSRDWAARGEPSSLEDWMDRAQDFTPIDLTDFFTAWIYADTVPARTAANGF